MWSIFRYRHDIPPYHLYYPTVMRGRHLNNKIRLVKRTLPKIIFVGAMHNV